MNNRYFEESIFKYLKSLLNFWEVYAYTASNNLHFAFLGIFKFISLAHQKCALDVLKV